MPTKHVTAAGLLLGLAFLSTSLSAQDFRPGYVVKMNGDSLKGYVKYTSRKNGSRCDFKSSKNSDHTSFGPSELSSYGFDDGRKYVSTTLTGTEKVFAKLLADGPLKLYSHEKVFYIQKDSIAMLPVPKGQVVGPVEAGGNSMEKKDKRYVSILNQYLVDCQLNANASGYSEGDLTRLVKNYNRCKGFSGSYSKPKPLYRMNVGMVAGYLTSKLSVDEDALVPFNTLTTSFEPSKTVVGGISLDFSSPRIYDKLFITLEGWYFSTTYIGKDYRDNFYQDITLDVSSIRLFVGFRYNFLHERSTPFIKAGLSGSAGQKMELTSIIEQENADGQVFYSDDFTGLVLERKVRGLWFSVGYDQLVVGKMKAFAEFRYESAEAYFGTQVVPDSRLKNLSILVGFRF